ncbi:hypothetical protein [Ekhidna sp.]|uniref:hypothetical protein n=1 Tax=Ekhidna sp. TaxID=2608089 RepID=UPI003298B474
MLHYIHIQGKEAPRFHFRDQTSRSFKSVIQSLAKGSPLVISSLYRTDILYHADADKSENILKLWELYSKPIEDRSVLTFVAGREHSLETFFTSLVALSSVSLWYNSYLEEFRHACSLDYSNPILQDLKNCEKYLQDSQKTVYRPLTEIDAADLLPRKEVYADLSKHFNDFLN